MEGARLWDRSRTKEGNVTQIVSADLLNLPKHNLSVEDSSPTAHAERNPLQQEHSLDEVEAISAHLKSSLEDVVVAIFEQVRSAALVAQDPVSDAESQQPLRVRWVEAYFPFTSPSWELEVLWQGDWLEILGCGVVKQSILAHAGVSNKLGWAFGVGLERLAMLLYSIPDIRLFWSKDERFTSQFAADQPTKRFVPFSRYPSCPRDVAFWVGGTNTSAGSNIVANIHENDVMQVVRDVGGDLVEYVKLVDDFRHRKTGRRSFCYNINYRSLERVISREEANGLHRDVCKQLEERLGVELR
ncbi:MAG: hypothetical protein LQ340_007160 [Diploschistes diacapsis]|nr:MAG: hypothetical protein LQ340_007160 [Diploschistes diacapsis]